MRRFLSLSPLLRRVRAEPLTSIHQVFPRSKFYCSARLQHFKGKDEARTRFSGVPIHSITVKSTLANCPSDLTALSFFLWCARQKNYFHDRYAFAHMVPVVARLMDRFKSVGGVVRQLENVGCLVKAQTFLLLLRIFWLGGIYQSAFDVWDKMVEYGYKPNTFAQNVIMDICFRTKLPDHALRILSENHAPNFLSFNIALDHLCKCNDLIEIKVVLRDMLRAGYYPNRETFVKSLNCFSKKGRLVEASQVLGFMVSLGFQASLPVWNILIDRFCKMGKPERASYLLEKMIDAGCSPNVITYTSLFRGFIKLDMVDEASQVLEKMLESQGCEIDLFHYNVLIDCFSKIGRHDEAVAMFFKLKQSKLEPDSYTFSSIISCLCSTGKYEILSKVLDGFYAPADLVLCNSLLNYFCKAGLLIHAVELYYVIIDMCLTPDKYSYTGLLDGLCRSGNLDKAINLHRWMVTDGLCLDAHCHTVIISRLFRDRKYHTAYVWFRQAVFKEYVLDAVSYRIVIHGLVRGGMIREAFTVFCQMKSLGMVPEASIHNILLYGFCRTGDFDMVIELLEQMLSQTVELDFRSFVKILDSMSRSRDYFVVFDLLIKMRDSELLSERSMHILLLEGRSRGIKVDERHYLLQGFTEEKSGTETSGSEDVLEIAAAG